MHIEPNHTRQGGDGAGRPEGGDENMNQTKTTISLELLLPNDLLRVKAINKDIYQKYKQKAPTFTCGEMNAFCAQRVICGRPGRKEAAGSVPR